MSANKPNIVLIGGGGHCVSVIDVIELENKYTIKGILDNFTKEKEVLGYPVLGGDELIGKLVDANVFFLITVGQIKSYTIREKIATKLVANKAQVATVISPLAYVSKHSSIGRGNVVMHKALVNAQVTIGNHCIINTKANIEHGALIEDFCHISTAAIVNGDTKIKRGSFIGSNATISNGVDIAKNSIIGAGKFVK